MFGGSGKDFTALLWFTFTDLLHPASDCVLFSSQAAYYLIVVLLWLLLRQLL